MSKQRTGQQKGRATELRMTQRPLPAPEGFGTLVTAGVSPRGPVAVWSSAAGKAELSGVTTQPDGPVFPKSVPDRAPRVALTAYSGDGELTATVEIPALPVAHPLVDRFPDGSFLVAGARSRWRAGGPELNAVVYGEHGEVLRRGCLGDGIEHVQVGEDGTVWVGYFDEGVFGNYGWGDPGPAPLGAGGIVAWTANLEKAWELDPEEGLVVDCYTLNVSGDEVLSSPYTDFPVVRIRAGEVTVTPTRGVSGPRGILRSGHRVGLIGSYDRPWQLVVGDLFGSSFAPGGRYRLTGPDGGRLPRGRLHCRGSVAHVFADGTWLTFDLDTLP